MHLKGITWDEIKKILIIILYSHHTLYQFQLSQEIRCQFLQLLKTTKQLFFYRRQMYLLRILS